MVESLVYSLALIISMVIGIYIGYKLRGDGGKDRLPDIKSPKQMIKEHKEKKADEQEVEELKDWIEEINNYNGEFGENERRI
jgi:hypothetical protein